MSQNAFRSSHLPVGVVTNRRGEFSFLPNRAAALFNLERYPMEKTIDRYTWHTITSKEEGAAPTLSFIYYQDINYWWAICYYNRIVFPTEELYAGREIKIPDFGQLKTYLALTKQIGEGTGRILRL